MTFNNDSSKFMKKKSLKESLVVVALSCKILINKLSKGILTVVRRALLHLMV